MLVNSCCLFCSAETETVTNENHNYDSKREKVLASMFTKLSQLLNIEFPDKWKNWRFMNEPFPFCNRCKIEISKVCCLHDQRRQIDENILRIVVNLTARTIESDSDRDNLKCESEITKYDHFRRNIIQRYKAKLKLKDCKAQGQEKDERRIDTVITDLESQEDDSNSAYDIRISTNIFDSDDEGEENNANNVDPPDGSSPKPSEVDRSASPTGSSCSVVSIADSPESVVEVPCTSNENRVIAGTSQPPVASASQNPRLNGSSTTKYLIVLAPLNPSAAFSVQNRGLNEPSSISSSQENGSSQDNSSSQKNSSSQENSSRQAAESSSTEDARIAAILSNFIVENEKAKNKPAEKVNTTPTPTVPVRPKKKIRKIDVPPSVWNFKRKCCLIKDNIYEYMGYRLRVDKERTVCLTCGHMCKPHIYHNNMRAHIKSVHIDKTDTGLKLGRVIMLDAATKKYAIDGFEFTEVEDGYKCLTCNKWFKKASEGNTQKVHIRHHIQKFHMRKYRGVCPICKEVKLDLRAHKRTHEEPKKSRERVCEVCGKLCKNNISLHQHRKLHEEYRFQCDQCGKKFVQKQALDSHMKMHASAKEFVCETCGQRFNFKNVLDTHIASKHSTDRPFACNQCDWTFGVKFLLNRHIRQVHEGKKAPPPKKRKRVAEAAESTEESCSISGDSSSESE